MVFEIAIGVILAAMAAGQKVDWENPPEQATDSLFVALGLWEQFFLEELSDRVQQKKFFQQLAGWVVSASTLSELKGRLVLFSDLLVLANKALDIAFLRSRLPTREWKGYWHVEYFVDPAGSWVPHEKRFGQYDSNVEPQSSYAVPVPQFGGRAVYLLRRERLLDNGLFLDQVLLFSHNLDVYLKPLLGPAIATCWSWDEKFVLIEHEFLEPTRFQLIPRSELGMPSASSR